MTAKHGGAIFIGSFVGIIVITNPMGSQHIFRQFIWGGMGVATRRAVHILELIQSEMYEVAAGDTYEAKVYVKL